MSGTVNAKRKKGNKKVVVVFVITLLITLTIAVLYFVGWSKATGKFLANTYINDIDVSGMSLTEAINVVSETQKQEGITITGRDGNAVEIDLGAFDYTLDIVDGVRGIFKEIDYSKWLGAYFKPTHYVVEVQPTYNADKLKRLVRTMEWGSIETSDAKIEKGTDGYYVKPEVYGDKLNSEKVADYVLTCFENGVYEVDLEKSGLYTEPRVLSDELKGKVKELNEKYNYTITYDFTYTTEELTGADVLNWVDENGNIDRTKVEGYVESLANKYDTFKTTRKFESTERGTITIEQGRYSTGQYGWWMDKEKTVNKLLQYIENGESVTVEPEYVVLSDSGYTYKGFASGRSASGDIGNTYIEVDLTNQHLWYYKDGELMFETDQIVTGTYNDEKRRTPYGVYSVYTKCEDYTMKTPEYSTKCKYFMRISFEGIGFHDLSRTVYGGDTYINNGSHGCINMKLDEVEQLYGMVERGTPVVMYY